MNLEVFKMQEASDFQKPEDLIPIIENEEHIFENELLILEMIKKKDRVPKTWKFVLQQENPLNTLEDIDKLIFSNISQILRKRMDYTRNGVFEPIEDQRFNDYQLAAESCQELLNILKGIDIEYMTYFDISGSDLRSSNLLPPGPGQDLQFPTDVGCKGNKPLYSFSVHKFLADLKKRLEATEDLFTRAKRKYSERAPYRKQTPLKSIASECAIEASLVFYTLYDKPLTGISTELILFWLDLPPETLDPQSINEQARRKREKAQLKEDEG